MRFTNNDNKEVQAGELRWPVEFQVMQSTPNGSGGRTEVWVKDFETRCQMRGVNAGETVDGGRDVSRNTVLLRIRYRKEKPPTTEMRAVINAVHYEVTSVQDRTGKRRTMWLEIVSLPHG